MNEQKDLGESQGDFEKPIELGQTGPISLPKLNVEDYVGRKVKISSVTEHKGNYGYFVKIVTDIVDTLDNGTELKGSKVIGLQQDEKGNIGWGEGTKMANFLNKMKVAHYRGLIGKEVIIQLTPPKQDGMQFLTFW